MAALSGLPSSRATAQETGAAWRRQRTARSAARSRPPRARRPSRCAPEIVPGGLAGDGIAVGEAVAAGLLGQQLGDQVVEQEAARRFRRIGGEAPGAGALADGVPGPHRVGVDAFHQLHLRLDAADAARRSTPSRRRRCPAAAAARAVHVEPVGAVDLPQPGILRAPGMVHRHRPLGDGVQRKFASSSAAPSNGGYQNGSGSK